MHSRSEAKTSQASLINILLTLLNMTSTLKDSPDWIQGSEWVSVQPRAHATVQPYKPVSQGCQCLSINISAAESSNLNGQNESSLFTVYTIKDELHPQLDSLSQC